MRLSGSSVTVGNNLCGGLSCPRNLSKRFWVSHQQHIGIGGFDKVPMLVRIFACDRLHHDRLRQLQIRAREELMCWNKFPSRVPCHIRNEALYL